MAPSLDPTIQRRIEIAQSQWPSLSNCYGCVDCSLLFASPESSEARCPFCGSRSTFDIAGRLNGDVVRSHGPAQQLRVMVDVLERTLLLESLTPPPLS